MEMKADKAILLEGPHDEVLKLTPRDIRARHSTNRSFMNHQLWPTNDRCLGPSRAWPTAHGRVWVVESCPGLGNFVKSVLELQGLTTCVFRDPAEAWKAFAFADPRPAILIADDLDGRAALTELMRRCRNLEPGARFVLLAMPELGDVEEWYGEAPDMVIPLQCCGPLLAMQLPRLLLP